VGNAGKHKLIHAIDILAGKALHPKVRELAERTLRKSGQPIDIDPLIIEAEQREATERRQKEAARKARLTAKARYTMRLIDPFAAFDIVAPSYAVNRGKSLSEKQRRLLRRQGIDPDSMTYSEGKTLLNELFRRWNAGLCTLRQADLLRKHGYN